ncbi:MAG: PKD domain-containing protein [Cyclobacteriaceae bacterium]
MKIKVGLWVLFMCAGIDTYSQSLSRNNWYFGNSTSGIRFNRVTGKATLQPGKATPFGTAGNATASDPSNANLIFYTDGANVFDLTHQIMPNGSGLNANPAGNQAVAIAAVPGQTNKYYVFTNTALNTTGGIVSYSVVDMSLFGNALFPAPALGNLEASKNVAISGLTNRSEAMIVLPHANGSDFWLITQQVSSQSYSVTLINAATYPAGPFTTTTTTGLGLPMTADHFAWHAGKKKLAVASQTSNVDAIVLTFDDATGALAFDRYIFNSAVITTNNQAIYDIEWSLNGDYLYYSVFGDAGVAGNVLQFDYNTPANSLTSILPSTVFRSYGLQMAPDSAIYHLYQASAGGPFLLGKILDTDSAAAKVRYSTSLFGSADMNGQQFPALLPRDTVQLVVSFTTSGTCQNAPTSFYPTVTPGADSLHWDFGDGRDTTAWSPIYTYQQAQAFNVTLTAFFQGQSKTATQAVNISANAMQLQLVQDTTACRSEFPPPRGTSSPKQFSVKVKVQGGNPVSYTWSNGDTGPTLTPDSAGYYYVVVQDAGGCSAYAGVNVKEYLLQDQRANIWYFGDKAGIDFNLQPAQALAAGPRTLNAPEGVAITCDRNGKVIFYTDGDQVFNKNDQLIASGIGGDPLSSQSALIVAVPGDETLYYIFTMEAINGTSGNMMYYSLFDLKQNGGLGAVVQQKVPLFARSTERLTANARWVIAHEYGNNTFRAYAVSSAGIGDPVLTSIGSDHSIQSRPQGEGYMKLGANNTLAVAYADPGVGNYIELFHLNDSTGHLTNYRRIDLKDPAGQVYGIEISQGGNKVFATVKGSPTPSTIYEYFLDSLEHPYFRNKVTNGSELGAIQTAPDGNMYVAVNGTDALARIQAVEDTTAISPVTFAAFKLAAGTTSRLGLPNFVRHNANATGGPSLDFAGVCLGDSTQFSGTPTDAIDNFLWSFGDGGGDNTGNPKHLYAAPATYTVSMKLTNRCGLDTTLIKPITIVAPPPRPTILPAVALCTGAVTLDANSPGLPGLTYAWTTQETTRQIVVNTQGVYAVTVTNSSGCTSQGQSIVVDNRPQVELGPDQTVCQNGFVLALDAQNPGATYAWTINGAASGATQTQAVTTTTTGNFLYSVTVTDPFTTCNVTDQLTISIKGSPVFTAVPTNTTACNTTTGKLDLTITSPATSTFSYFITGPAVFRSAITRAPGSYAETALGAGTYSIVVNDEISGCSFSQTTAISDNTFTVSSPNAAICTTQALVVSTSAPSPYQYTITDSNGATVDSGTTSGASFNSKALPPETYTIQVTSGTCSVAANNVVISQKPQAQFTTTNNVCGSPATITASGANSYVWTGPGIVSGQNANVLSVNPGSGTFNYSVTGTTPGVCDFTQSVSITIPVAVTPDFTQSDPCQTAVVLTATPGGNYTYRWYRNTVFVPTLLGQQVTLGLPDNGLTYAVQIVDTQSGCTYTSAGKQVSAFGPVDASLTSTPPCQDGKPFTLTAGTSATGVSYTWFLNGESISGATSNTLDQTADGLYRVDISKGTCLASASINIIKAPLPTGLLPDRIVICNDPDNNDPTTSHYDLDPGFFSQYDWYKNELSINYSTRVLTVDSQGLYRVDLTNSFGCVASDQTEVRNDCIPKLVSPNAFKPSSSISDNRDFRVFSFFITDNFHIYIFDRWGEMVYQSSDRDFRWNGGYNNEPGKPLPGGTYSYVIKYVSSFRPDQGVQEKHGGVVLLR